MPPPHPVEHPMRPSPRPGPLKVLGLLGGIGPASTRLYYEELYAEARRRFGVGPRIVVNSLDFDYFTWLEDHDRVGYTEHIREGLQALQAGGAEVLAMAANSPHAVFEEASKATPLPLVSIVESVGRSAQCLGLRSALLLGIPATMRASFYPTVCERFGLRIETPHQRHDAELRRIIFEELTAGHRLPSSRRRLLRILDEHDVEGLILGCTELPDLIGPEDTEVPLLDSARLHVTDILTALSPSDLESSP